MRKVVRRVPVLLAAITLAGCASGTGKTLGQSIDDAAITARITARLVEADPANLVRVDVDTNRGVVYLNGVVPDAAAKQRAADIAWKVPGARVVINELQVRSPG